MRREIQRLRRQLAGLGVGSTVLSAPERQTDFELMVLPGILKRSVPAYFPVLIVRPPVDHVDHLEQAILSCRKDVRRWNQARKFACFIARTDATGLLHSAFDALTSMR